MHHSRMMWHVPTIPRTMKESDLLLQDTLWFHRWSSGRAKPVYGHVSWESGVGCGRSDQMLETTGLGVPVKDRLFIWLTVHTENSLRCTLLCTLLCVHIISPYPNRKALDKCKWLFSFTSFSDLRAENSLFSKIVISFFTLAIWDIICWRVISWEKKNETYNRVWPRKSTYLLPSQPGIILMRN